jgi:hypothetical protein
MKRKKKPKERKREHEVGEQGAANKILICKQIGRLHSKGILPGGGY